MSDLRHDLVSALVAVGYVRDPWLDSLIGILVPVIEADLAVAVEEERDRLARLLEAEVDPPRVTAWQKFMHYTNSEKDDDRDAWLTWAADVVRHG